MAFKVIEVGTKRKPVCDLLLVINSNWHPISYRFGVITAFVQILLQRGHIDSKLQLEGVAPTNNFSTNS